MRKIVRAVAMITGFTVITRALGFGFRIYLSRMLGAEMLGAYQVAISVFGVLCTIIASGIPLMISRNVASFHKQKDLKKEGSIVSSGLLLSILLAIASCAIVFLFPSLLNGIFTSNNSTTILIWLLPGVIASAVYCTFRGALWGQKNYFMISFTELFEQVIRIVICFILFAGIFKFENSGVVAAASLSIACCASALFVTIYYFAKRNKLGSPFVSFVPLVKSSSPITAVRTLSSFVQSLIAIIIPIQLVLAGWTEQEAIAQFGIVVGMALPLITIPGTIVGSIATAVVPEISENFTSVKELKTNPKLSIIKQRIDSSINATLLVGFVLVPIFIVLGPQIGTFLFSNELAGTYTAKGALLIIPMTLSQISSSVLNSMGLEFRSLWHYVIGAIIMFACLYVLPAVVGIDALIWGFAGLSITTSSLNIMLLAKHHLISRRHLKTFALLSLFCLPCALIAKYVYALINLIAPMFVSLAIAGTLAVFFFGMLTIITKQFDLQVVFSRKRIKK